MHPPGIAAELPLIVVTSRDASLVRDDHEHITGLARRPREFEDSRHPVRLLRRVDIAMGDVDGPVAVEEQRTVRPRPNEAGLLRAGRDDRLGHRHAHPRTSAKSAWARA